MVTSPAISNDIYEQRIMTSSTKYLVDVASNAIVELMELSTSQNNMQ